MNTSDKLNKIKSLIELIKRLSAPPKGIDGDMTSDYETISLHLEKALLELTKLLRETSEDKSANKEELLSVFALLENLSENVEKEKNRAGNEMASLIKRIQAQRSYTKK